MKAPSTRRGQLLSRLPLPRTIGSQCLLGLLLGALVALMLPGLTPWLMPLGQIFLRASQIVVMPYLICELLGALGGLSTPSMRLLARFGGLVLLALMLVGSLMVLWLPSLLPDLNASGFFEPESLIRPTAPDLIATYLPFNIFTALAQDNFPAVVLFATVAGVLLQGLPRRELLLEPLEQLRLMFRRLNTLVIRLAPMGVLALTATTLRQMSLSELLRSQALLLINLVALVVLVLLFVVVLWALTPLSLGAVWRILRGPLALTASSGNLLIALPMLNESLQRALAPLVPAGSEQARAMAFEEIAALLPVGFALPTLGQVVSLVFVPFCAWFVDRPFPLEDGVRMLLTGIPTVAGGLKAAVRQELLAAALPTDLIALVDLNGNWLYRGEKVLSLLGLVLLVVMVVCRSLGLLRLRPLRLGLGLLLSLLLALALGHGSTAVLARQLRNTYENDRTLLSQRSLVRQASLRLVRAEQLRSEPVSLAAIRRRGVLRVGLRRDAMPWAFDNASGDLVGFDVDLLHSLARAMNVQLEVVQASLRDLELMLQRQQIDLAAGGIQNTPQRAASWTVSVGYQQVHLALLTRDEDVGWIQKLPTAPLQRPLRLAVSDTSLIGANLRDQIAELLGPPGRPQALSLRPVNDRRVFFGPRGRQFDALLITAEGGAAWSVLHPQTSLVTAFDARLPEELVILIGGQDGALEDYIDTWILRKQDQGLIRSLFEHWVMLRRQPLGR